MRAPVTTSNEAKSAVLTDRALKALRPAEPGKRYIKWDAALPSFGARVTDKGHVTFIVMRRLDGKLVRRGLGTYPRVSLEDARRKAREALEDLSRGIDPKAKQQAAREERERRARDSFSAVADEFIRRHVSTLRTHKEVEAGIRRQLIPRWADRPISNITRRDVATCLHDIADSSGPYAAHKTLAYISKLFNWALARETYGLEHSPCDRIKPADVIGRREVRQRVLSDAEIRAFWGAATDTPYPFGPLFLLLLLTGQRRDEAADMEWSEVDLAKRLWTIPAARMKGDAPHLVPLADAAIDLLQRIPRFSGPFVFTTTGGERPVSGFSKAKARLDSEMLKAMRKSAAEHGFASESIALEPWRLHDLRRTARTHFSAIPSQDLVRELAISHARPGLHKVYDQFAYVDEKRALFEAWAVRLKEIARDT